MLLFNTLSYHTRLYILIRFFTFMLASFDCIFHKPRISAATHLLGLQVISKNLPLAYCLFFLQSHCNLLKKISRPYT